MPVLVNFSDFSPDYLLFRMILLSLSLKIHTVSTISSASGIKCSKAGISQNNHELPENSVLMYSQVLFIRNSSFQENGEPKLYSSGVHAF